MDLIRIDASESKMRGCSRNLLRTFLCTPRSPRDVSRGKNRRSLFHHSRNNLPLLRFQSIRASFQCTRRNRSPKKSAREKEKKARNFGPPTLRGPILHHLLLGPHPSGPTPFGPHLSPPPFAPPHPLGSTFFLGLGPHPSSSSPFRAWLHLPGPHHETHQIQKWDWPKLDWPQLVKSG